MPDVRMPDGTIIRNVPEGTTRSELERRMKAKSAPKDNRPESFWQGVLDEVGKAGNNMVWLADQNPLQQVSRAITGLSKTSDYTRDALRNQQRRSPYQGSTAGKITGGIAATLPTALMPGGALAQGAAAGGLLTEDPNNPNGVARDMAIGAVTNKAGEQVGKRVLAPVAERVGRTRAARAVSSVVSNIGGRLGKDVPRLPLPKVTRPERIVQKANPEVEDIRKIVQEAADLGLPFSLADAAPKLRNLGGSVSRFSPSGRALAEKNYIPRGRGQADRAVEGIDKLLAPITDIKKRSADIIEGGKPTYGPLYDQAYAAPAITSPTIEGILSRQMVKPAIGRANTIADAEFRNPRAMGFGVDDLGEPVLNPVPAQAIDRFDAGRQGWDAANDAYQAAVARQRASLHPQQFSQQVDDAERALAAANTELDAAKGGFAAAPKSSDVQDRMAYTTQSLDYIKRGIDDVLEPQRNQITGKLNLDESGRALNNLQRTLLGEMDNLNPAYGEARQAYAGFAQQAEALRTGHEVLPSGKLPMRDFDAITSRMAPENLPEAQRGYATAMADAVDRQRLSANPYEAIYGSPQNQAKIATLFPEGAPRFNRQYELEKDMALTQAETLGGSQTQPRAMADQMFQNDMVNGAADAGIQALTGGGIPGGTKLLGMAAQMLKDRSSLGLMGAQKKADELAPALFDTSNPQNILDFIDDLVRKQAEQRTRDAAYQRASGLLGLPVAATGVGLSR